MINRYPPHPHPLMFIVIFIFTCNIRFTYNPPFQGLGGHEQFHKRVPAAVSTLQRGGINILAGIAKSNFEPNGASAYDPACENSCCFTWFE